MRYYSVASVTGWTASSGIHNEYIQLDLEGTWTITMFAVQGATNRWFTRTLRIFYRYVPHDFGTYRTCAKAPFNHLYSDGVVHTHREVADDIIHLELSFLLETTSNVFYSILMYFERIFSRYPSVN